MSTIELSVHKPYMGRFRFISQTKLRPGMLIHLRYTGLEATETYRYGLVLNESWNGKCHVMRLDYLSRSDIQRIIELIWIKQPSYAVYQTSIKPYMKPMRGYRTYFRDKMSQISQVEYDFWNIKKPVYTPGIFYFNPDWGRQGAILIGYTDNNVPADFYFDRRDTIDGYPVQIFRQIQQKLSEYGIWYNLYDNISSSVATYIDDYELKSNKLRHWSYNDQALKQIIKNLPENTNQNELRFDAFLGFAKKVGGVFFVPSSTIDVTDISHIKQKILFTSIV